jgi:hypothetical protein
VFFREIPWQILLLLLCLLSVANSSATSAF